jgi:hypothetical protein
MTGITPFLCVVVSLAVLTFYVSYKASQQESENLKNNIKTVPTPSIL